MTGRRSIRGIVEGHRIPTVFISALIDLYLQGRFPFNKLLSFTRSTGSTRPSTTPKRALPSSRSFSFRQ